MVVEKEVKLILKLKYGSPKLRQKTKDRVNETPKCVYPLIGYLKLGHRSHVAHNYYYKNEHYAKADQKRFVEELMKPRGRGKES